MKIPVNVKALNIDMETYIKQELNVKKLPECLGCMIPPIVEDTPEVVLEDLFKESASVDSINIMKINPKDIVPEIHVDKVEGLIISKQSFDVINEQMKAKAKHYVTEVSKCLNCEHADICNKLTTNYLKVIELSLSK
jgi:hypothetical protein